ncbi:MAG TPA: tyrosine-type recombinase/integrase, partial [Rhizomicrobium sp.]|nr:tyrosine-type recombinase/integrase [Rhizomicrobium sp.]
FVDLTDFAMVALLRQKAHTFMKNTGVIFCTPEGDPWPNEKRQRLRFFQPALKACGVRARVPYNTRHTFATIDLMAGINPNYIASQLGHTNTAMLFQRYAKWIPGADDGRAAAQMNSAFGAHRIGPQLVPKTRKL